VLVWKHLSSTFAPILNIFFNGNAFYPYSFETCQQATMRVPRLYFSPTLCSSSGHSTMFDSKIHTKISTSSKNVFSLAVCLHELCRPSKNHTIFLPDRDPAEPKICTISGTPTLHLCHCTVTAQLGDMQVCPPSLLYFWQSVHH
jgi:hypothetical protein